MFELNALRSNNSIPSPALMIQDELSLEVGGAKLKKVDDSKIKYFFLLFGLQASAGDATFRRKANVRMSENMKLNRETEIYHEDLTDAN